jgi:hypothetical protein
MRRILLVLAAAAALGLPVAAAADSPVAELVEGTGVLLDQSSGGGGNGGNTSSTSNYTNVFTPSAYVDYHRFGSEPSVVVDHYAGGNDAAYSCGPLGVGFPGFSYFFRSTDLGATWRLPTQDPIFGRAVVEEQGGGDCHIAVGQVTHRVFFVDLSGPDETINVSDDQGQTFRSAPLGSGLAPGTIDDRPWLAVDELRPDATKKVYDSFIDYTDIVNPTLAVAISNEDGELGTYGEGPCNAATVNVPPPTDATPTVCPDPFDKMLQVAGPTVVDLYRTHNVYIPFIRGTSIVPGLTAGPPWSLWIARSTDGGNTWTRSQVALLGDHNPSNIFPEMTVDRGGNLYFTWSQSQGPLEDVSGHSGFFGEQDVYYAYSTDVGTTWSPPIDLTKETGDSAVFPWMVAGDPGQVDLVYYKANTGLNSNAAGVDANGNPCDPDSDAGCADNPSVWNTYFAQSQNALNTGANFKSVQITDHPNHLGQICTLGLACSGDRNLADFISVDVDHLGAANVVWTDTNNSNNDARIKFSRQVAGASVFKSQSIALQSAWPIRDHTVTDPAGDVTNADGLPAGSCAGMDVLSTSSSRSGDTLTISLTLNGPPTALGATTCSGAQATGGLWGAEFWASDSPSDNYYVAYRDNPPDGGPAAEAGRLAALSPTETSNEFQREEPATVGGTCTAVLPPAGACTLTITASLAGLGIKQGAGLYSLTGLSVYLFGSATPLPMTRIGLGISNQADVTAALDQNGTGTTK